MGTYDPVPGKTAYGLPVYKKRRTEKWLQCSAELSRWMVQTKDCRHTKAGCCYSSEFLNIYECKLPHEMTEQWIIRSNRKGWIKIDVKFTALPSSLPGSSSASNGSVAVSPV